MAKKDGKKKQGPRKKHRAIFENVRETREGEVDALTRALSKEEAALGGELETLGRGLNLTESGLADITRGTQTAASQARVGLLSRFGLEQESRGVRQEVGEVDFMNALRSGRAAGRAQVEELATQRALAEAQAQENALDRALQRERLQLERDRLAAEKQDVKSKRIRDRIETFAIQNARENGRDLPTREDYLAAEERLLGTGKFKPFEVTPIAGEMSAVADSRVQQQEAVDLEARQFAQERLITGDAGSGIDPKAMHDLAVATVPVRAFGRTFANRSEVQTFVRETYGEAALQALNAEIDSWINARLAADEERIAAAKRRRDEGHFLVNPFDPSQLESISPARRDDAIQRRVFIR